MVLEKNYNVAKVSREEFRKRAKIAAKTHSKNLIESTYKYADDSEETEKQKVKSKRLIKKLQERLNNPMELK